MTKELYLQELEGYTVPFDHPHLNNLLNNAASQQQCEEFLALPDNPVYGEHGWKGVPETATDENELYEPLVNIFNAILDHFKLSDSRKAFDTHPKNMRSRRMEKMKSRPDIVITGSGQHFRGDVLECKKWYQCLSSIEVKRDSNKVEEADESEQDDKVLDRDEYVDEEDKGEEEGKGAREAKVVGKAIPERCTKMELEQPRYYARQTFSAQPTRMFVYNILITESRVRLLCFDRVGLQYSRWINYREEPFKLVQMIALVTGSDPESIGLDKTVTFTKTNIHFTLQKDNQPWVVTSPHKPRFSSLELRGRATVCWSVRDSDQKPYLLKQQFVSTNRKLEHEILEDLQRKAKETGADLSRVGRCIMGQTFGKVSEARGMSTAATQNFHDRWCYRVLLVEYGDTIDNINQKTALDVLVALRDAIEAHKTLWDAGIVHRDVSCNNILYRDKHGTASNHRGVLIDLDLAFELLREEGDCKRDFRTGTRAFQSINVLESYKIENESGEKLPIVLHDHIDDLEAFFWVLLWITRQQVGPGATPSDVKIPTLVVCRKFESEAELSALYKKDMLSHSRALALQPGWGEHETKLVRKLGKYFHTLYEEKWTRTTMDGIALTATQLIKDAPTHYSTVLEYFDDTINAMKEAMQSLPNPNAKQSHSTKYTPYIRTSSKRSHDAGPSETPDEFNTTVHPPPEKRVRTAKSKSALTQVKPVAASKKLGKAKRQGQRR